jgi:hypothetical protein
MSNPLTPEIAKAITRQEGWGPGTASYRNNNPGNIMDYEYYKQTGGKFRLQKYNSLEEGTAALYKLIDKYIDAGHTLISFFSKYAPSGHGDNDPNAYARNVASWTGLPLDVPLKQVTLQAPTAVPGQQLAATGPDDGGAAPGPVSEAGIGTLPLLLIAGTVGAALWYLIGD